MITKIKTIFAVSLLAAFLFTSCASHPQKKGKRMSNSGPHRKIRTEMGNM